MRQSLRDLNRDNPALGMAVARLGTRQSDVHWWQATDGGQSSHLVWSAPALALLPTTTKGRRLIWQRRDIQRIHADGLDITIKAYGQAVTVRMASAQDLDDVQALLAASAVAPRIGVTGGVPVQIRSLRDDDRTMRDVVYLGGTGNLFRVRDRYNIYFLGDTIAVDGAIVPHTQEWPLSDLRDVALSGRGEIRTGGGFVGGGFGVKGAAEGIAAAAVLNALTTKTHLECVVTLTLKAGEFWFLSTKHTPETARLALAPVFHRLQQSAAPAPAPPGSESSLATQLRDLADLHSQGLLTPEEFSAAKRRLLSG